MSSEQQPQSGWGKMTSWLAGLTGVLVVIPALINAGLDIYGAWKKIPRTETERINVELFQKYFGKQPKQSFPLQIKRGGGFYEVKFSVFEEGDIFIEYGALTQWFPFPHPPTQANTTLSPIYDAVAQDVRESFGRYEQSEELDGHRLLRERLYDNGDVERQSIDIRTGQIIEREVTRSNRPPPQQAPSDVGPFSGIDLDAANPTSPRSSPIATMCITQVGACAMVQAIPKGSSCFCPTVYGPVWGIGN